MKDDFIKFLSTLKLNYSFFRNKTVEIDLRGCLNPNKMLDYFFFDMRKWVGFNDFYKEYVSEFYDELKNYHKENYPQIPSNDFLYGLEARLYRTQCSILTEYQAYIECQEVFGYDNVVRSTYLDNNGVDIRLDYNNQYYNLHIFTDTDRAWEFRNYKSKNKKSNKLKGIHINLPYDKNCKNFTATKLKNGFAIYTNQYIEYLKNQIDNKVISIEGKVYSPKVSRCPNF
tara:strand:+ start:615 stop:1298 length:684 start_codon:yes stop_codon:yes gene_type:complete